MSVDDVDVAAGALLTAVREVIGLRVVDDRRRRALVELADELSRQGRTGDLLKFTVQVTGLTDPLVEVRHAIWTQRVAVHTRPVPVPVMPAPRDRRWVTWQSSTSTVGDITTVTTRPRLRVWS